MYGEINTKKVILDVDTGLDDAIAIMLSILSSSIDLIGITTVNGNKNIEYTTENTLRVVEFLNSNCPVYKGCHLPLVSTLIEGRRDGMPFGSVNDIESMHSDFLPLPKSKTKHKEEHAVFWIIDTLKNAKEKITLIAVAPLTNIAMALRIEPEITENIEEIIIMGGGYNIKNVTAGAEFNFWVDPEAAKIVLDSGAKITLVPLDATHEAYFSKNECKELAETGNKYAVLASEIINLSINAYNEMQPMKERDIAPIHDALAVISAINKEVLKDVIHTYVDVSISIGASDGMSILDTRSNRKNKENCYVATGADRELFCSIFNSLFS